MSGPELDEPWNWRVLTIECPQCGMSCAYDTAQTHIDWHWLTKTQTERIYP